jgi:teichuronic acid biosynthesis glycosyltransferase TuaG
MGREFIAGLVSVITPVYNAEKVIEKALQSVFAQTYKHYEIVLVDDCSTDNSRNEIEKFIPFHPEIVYFRQPTNQGAGVARNKALELAKGQYVAFLDADDMWLPEKIEKQILLLNEKIGSFSYTAIQMVDENDRIIKQKRNVKSQLNYPFLLRNTMIATSSVLIDRRVMGDFRMPQRRGGQDYATWLMLLRGGNVAFGINDALVKYRISKKSLSSNKIKSIGQVWKIQTQDEKIGKTRAALNVFCFAINAFIKYFF